MRLLLVPHAQTEWNAQGRFLGHTDIPLNDRGKRQAQVLRHRLAQETLQEIVASDLRRAWETAEVLAVPHGLAPGLDSRLRELNFGAWEGLTYAEIKEKYPCTLASWHQDPLQASPPDGEPLAGLAQRLQSFLHDLLGHPRGSTILVVAHRGSLRTLLCLLLGTPLEKHWEFRLEMASLSEVELIAGKAVLVRLNVAPPGCEVEDGR